MKPKAWIECEDPDETFPLLMSSYVVKIDGKTDPVFRAAPFGKQACFIWGLFHGYWLKENE